VAIRVACICVIRVPSSKDALHIVIAAHQRIKIEYKSFFMKNNSNERFSQKADLFRGAGLVEVFIGLIPVALLMFFKPHPIGLLLSLFFLTISFYFGYQRFRKKVKNAQSSDKGYIFNLYLHFITQVLVLVSVVAGVIYTSCW
jgi:hypothetical protein